MSRKVSIIDRRRASLDPIYRDAIVSKFINCLMVDGKKSTAERCFYKAFSLIKNQTKQDPLQIFLQGVENAKPLMEVKPIRIGGSTYQVPIELLPHRQLSLTLKWIISSSKSRGEPTISARLAKEIVDCYQRQGQTIKRREEMHKTAEANRAFSHYRW